MWMSCSYSWHTSFFYLCVCFPYFQAVPLVRSFTDSLLLFPLSLYISLSSLSLFGLYKVYASWSMNEKEGGRGREREKERGGRGRGRERDEREKERESKKGEREQMGGSEILWSLSWLIVPYLPSSNLFVYPGTYIGEVCVCVCERVGVWVYFPISHISPFLYSFLSWRTHPHTHTHAYSHTRTRIHSHILTHRDCYMPLLMVTAFFYATSSRWRVNGLMEREKERKKLKWEKGIPKTVCSFSIAHAHTHTHTLDLISDSFLSHTQLLCGFLS